VAKWRAGRVARREAGREAGREAKLETGWPGLGVRGSGVFRVAFARHPDECNILRGYLERPLRLNDRIFHKLL
jgi:hypothetical protein